MCTAPDVPRILHVPLAALTCAIKKLRNAVNAGRHDIQVAEYGGDLAGNHDHKIWVCRQKPGRPPRDCGWIRFDNNR